MCQSVNILKSQAMGIWCSLYYSIVTMLSLMKWKITSLVRQCKCSVVIYKPYLGIIATHTMAIRPIVNTSDSLWSVLLITKAVPSSAFRAQRKWVGKSLRPRTLPEPPVGTLALCG